MEKNIDKRNELFTAYINEVFMNGNECSLIDGHPNFLSETPTRVLTLKKTNSTSSTTLGADLFKDGSTLSCYEEEVFKSGIDALERKLAIDEESRELELMHQIREARRKERELIGYELHDNVNQILASARLLLDMIDPSSQHDKEIHKKVSELIRRAYDEIRMISRKLTSTHCLKDTLRNELQCLVDEIRLTRKFIVQFEHDFNEEFVSSLARINLYRIAQEQLKNILEYSKAKNIIISLKEIKDQLFFYITDDGVGFDQQTYRQGLGHTNIFQRVKELKGQVEFKTEKGRGCSLLVTIPIDNK